MVIKTIIIEITKLLIIIIMIVMVIIIIITIILIIVIYKTLWTWCKVENRELQNGMCQ